MSEKCDGNGWLINQCHCAYTEPHLKSCYRRPCPGCKNCQRELVCGACGGRRVRPRAVPARVPWGTDSVAFGDGEGYVDCGDGEGRKDMPCPNACQTTAKRGSEHPAEEWCRYRMEVEVKRLRAALEQIVMPSLSMGSVKKIARAALEES